MTALQLSAAALLSTSAGGLFALRLRDRLHSIVGIMAAALLGIAVFELLPESVELWRRAGGDGRGALVAPLAGFLLFHGLDRFLKRRGHAACCAHTHAAGLGVASAAALVGHSFMDGVGMGLAFQVSPAVGASVAIAVIAHDFCDGLNTVGLMLRHGNPTARTLLMLGLDAGAPLLGAASTLAYRVPPETLAPYLGFFAGSLLYVGASVITARFRPCARSGNRSGSLPA